MKFGTKAIHAGFEGDPLTGAIMPPIYQTSTYIQEAPAQHKGYEYSRTANPTRTILEKNLAALENGKYGRAFSSGMGACDAILKLLEAGDHVVAGHDLYGGTYRQFTKVFQKFGISFTFVNTTDLQNIENAIQENTRMIWVETPSNPLLSITDIEGVAKIGEKHGIITVVDNTFATPYIQNPLDMGISIVTHSTTKYFGGHSDVVGGCTVTNSQELDEQLGFIQNSSGAVPGPMDCFLVLRGTKTLHVRMERHCQNAERIARYLADHKQVKSVLYPGLESHPGHEIAKKQMRAFGGMISVNLQGSLEDAKKFVSTTKIFSLAESLGGVESLIEHPASMTHASVPRAERIKAGFEDGLIRLSVGIEDIEDLLEDLDQAFQKTFG